MRQMFEQQLVKMWDEKEDAALDSGDPDAYCLAAVNRRVAQTIAIASREGWSSWKTRSISKYVTKGFESMAKVELSTIRDQAFRSSYITQPKDDYGACPSSLITTPRRV